jgi:hypothetical protein
MGIASFMKRVFIAHQLSIPHDRCSFDNAIEQQRPPRWKLKIVSDPSEAKSQHFLKG